MKWFVTNRQLMSVKNFTSLLLRTAKKNRYDSRALRGTRCELKKRVLLLLIKSTNVSLEERASVVVA